MYLFLPSIASQICYCDRSLSESLSFCRNKFGTRTHSSWSRFSFCRGLWHTALFWICTTCLLIFSTQISNFWKLTYWCWTTPTSSPCHPKRRRGSSPHCITIYMDTSRLDIISRPLGWHTSRRLYHLTWYLIHIDDYSSRTTSFLEE